MGWCSTSVACGGRQTGLVKETCTADEQRECLHADGGALQRKDAAAWRGFDGRSAGDEDVCCALGVSQARQELWCGKLGERSQLSAAGAARSCAARGLSGRAADAVIVWAC